MALMTLPFVFIAVTLAAILPAAFAIECWDCSSYINPGCGDPFNSYQFAKVDCSQKPMDHLPKENRTATLCRKVIQKIDGGRPHVIRGCGWLWDDSVDKACFKRSGTQNVLAEYCTCTKDGCNGASSLYNLTSVYFVTLFTALGILLKL